jgi:hypothetical protein
MFQIATAFAISALFCVPAPAEQKKQPTVNLYGKLFGEVAEGHAKDMPPDGVIVSQKTWEKLAEAWGIKDAPKVDFAKEFLVVVGTFSEGSRLAWLEEPKLDRGDLTLPFLLAVTADLGPPGFVYHIRSVSREGVKTVNGKELPKE